MKLALVPLVFFTLVVATLADEVKPYFTPAVPPAQDCRAAILSTLDDANEKILVEEYNFNDEGIAKALVDKARQKPTLTIKVLLKRDKVNTRIADYLTDPAHNANHNIEVKIDRHFNHNKVMVIDDATVITGSYNLTAKHHLDNLVVIHGKETAKTFADDWQKHFDKIKDDYKGQKKIPQTVSPTTEQKKDQPATELKYWLTIRTGVRHNSKCGHYGKTKGRPCGKDEGHACKHCGG